MLSHTHGQVATPTTIGKEFKVFEYRIKKVQKYLKTIEFSSKFGGTVGNYNCHVVSNPEIDWIKLSQDFIESIIKLYPNLTTKADRMNKIVETMGRTNVYANVLADNADRTKN